MYMYIMYINIYIYIFNMYTFSVHIDISFRNLPGGRAWTCWGCLNGASNFEIAKVKRCRSSVSHCHLLLQKSTRVDKFNITKLDNKIVWWGTHVASWEVGRWQCVTLILCSFFSYQAPSWEQMLQLRPPSQVIKEKESQKLKMCKTVPKVTWIYIVVSDQCTAVDEQAIKTD